MAGKRANANESAAPLYSSKLIPLCVAKAIFVTLSGTGALVFFESLM